jgi:hypothetical protein
MALAIGGNRGLYMTACEQSPNRTQIDIWLNEDKSFMWISKQLEAMGEKISDKSISKYAKYREEHVTRELEKNPVYQAQIQKATQSLVDEASKIKSVNVLNHLSNMIDQSAELLAEAREDENVRIKNVQDMRFVSMTFLESLKIYTETIMKAQAFQKIEENPDLLRPAVNINVKKVLLDMMGGMSDEQRFEIVDRIRGGLGQYVEGGLRTDPVDGGSSNMDGEE